MQKQIWHSGSSGVDHLTPSKLLKEAEILREIGASKRNKFTGRRRLSGSVTPSYSSSIPICKNHVLAAFFSSQQT
jgi:hypothetical protein